MNFNPKTQETQKKEQLSPKKSLKMVAMSNGGHSNLTAYSNMSVGSFFQMMNMNAFPGNNLLLRTYQRDPING